MRPARRRKRISLTAATTVRRRGSASRSTNRSWSSRREMRTAAGCRPRCTRIGSPPRSSCWSTPPSDCRRVSHALAVALGQRRVERLLREGPLEVCGRPAHATFRLHHHRLHPVPHTRARRRSRAASRVMRLRRPRCSCCSTDSPTTACRSRGYGWRPPPAREGVCAAGARGSCASLPACWCTGAAPCSSAERRQPGAGGLSGRAWCACRTSNPLALAAAPHRPAGPRRGTARRCRRAPTISRAVRPALGAGPALVCPPRGQRRSPLGWRPAGARSVTR